jgi:hypothetical protein
METLSGHLTATNKKHIKAILDAKMTEAKVNTINYFLTLEDSVYTVKVVQADKSIVFGPKIRTDKATFTI